jgi:hypothetical protein
MIDAETISHNQLDDLVASEIYGSKIVGRTTCYFVDGQWGVAPDTDPDSWMCPACERSVIVDRCCCDSTMLEMMDGEAKDQYNKRIKHDTFAGHYIFCLTAVPQYSDELGLALDIVSKLNPCMFSLNYIDNCWIAELYDAITSYKAIEKGSLFDTTTASAVVCRAALKFAMAPGKIPNG